MTPSQIKPPKLGSQRAFLNEAVTETFPPERSLGSTGKGRGSSPDRGDFPVWLLAVSRRLSPALSSSELRLHSNPPLQSSGLCVLLHHDPFPLPLFSICYLHAPQISPSFRALPLNLPPGHLPRPFQCQEPSLFSDCFKAVLSGQNWSTLLCGTLATVLL